MKEIRLYTSDDFTFVSAMIHSVERHDQLVCFFDTYWHDPEENIYQLAYRPDCQLCVIFGNYRISRYDIEYLGSYVGRYKFEERHMEPNIIAIPYKQAYFVFAGDILSKIQELFGLKDSILKVLINDM